MKKWLGRLAILVASLVISVGEGGPVRSETGNMGQVQAKMDVPAGAGSHNPPLHAEEGR